MGNPHEPPITEQEMAQSSEMPLVADGATARPDPPMRLGASVPDTLAEVLPESLAATQRDASGQAWLELAEGAVPLLSHAHSLGLPARLDLLETIVERLGELHAAGWLAVSLDPEFWVMTDRGPQMTNTVLVRPCGQALAAEIESGYSAPEAARGQVLEPVADVYGFGRLAFHLVMGHPFDMLEDSVRDMPLVWHPLFLPCLAERAEQRPADMAAVARMLATIRAEIEPISRVAVVGLTCTGSGREENQDALFHSVTEVGSGQGVNLRGVFAVVDGMGGMRHGARAAQAAIAALATAVAEAHAQPVFDPMPALLSANAAVLAVGSPGEVGAAASFVVLQENELRLAHVGDTRVYLWRNGQVIQLTEDHSVPALLCKGGLLEPEKRRGNPDRNRLNQYLGDARLSETLIQTRFPPVPDPAMLADGFDAGMECQTGGVASGSGVLSLCDGDQLLLCSDGLWDWWDDGFTEAEERDYLSQVLGDRRLSLHQRAQRLQADALHRDGQDNVTLLLLEFHRGPRLELAGERKA